MCMENNMKCDVKLNTEKGIFKYRVSGALIVNNKILALRMMNNDFYCLPGGHVALGEFSNDAVEREFEEEVKTDVTVKAPIAIIESIFDRKDKVRVHEVGITYVLQQVGDLKIPFEDYDIVELDDGMEKSLHFKWIDLDDIANYDFRPAVLKEQLSKKDFELKHYITN